MTTVDVVVIGGGFAGVTAARDLRKRGLNVLVLEARDPWVVAPGVPIATDFTWSLVAPGFTGPNPLCGPKRNAIAWRFRKRLAVSPSG